MGAQGLLIPDNERLDILNDDGLCVLQKTDAFRFGTDSVLLADFVKVKPGDRVVDLGTGTGVIAILIASRHPGVSIDALDIQPDMTEMAARSVSLNAMSEIIKIHTLDMRGAAAFLGYGAYAVAVCNPPYCKAGGALTSQSETRRIARHEDALTISDVAKAASELLKVGGRFYAVFPAARMLELACALREYKLEPKRVRTVHDKIEKAPKLILMDAVKWGGSQLHWMPPLIMNDGEGNPSEEWKRIYRLSPPGL